MKQIKESGDENLIKEQIHYRNCFKEFLLRIHSKIETYNGQTKVKHQVLNVLKPDFQKQCHGLMNIINGYLNLQQSKE